MNRRYDHGLSDIEIIAYADHSVVVLAVEHLGLYVIIRARGQLLRPAVAVGHAAIYLICVLQILYGYAVEICLVDYSEIDRSSTENERESGIALLCVFFGKLVELFLKLGHIDMIFFADLDSEAVELRHTLHYQRGIKSRGSGDARAQGVKLIVEHHIELILRHKVEAREQVNGVVDTVDILEEILG